ncbi:aspartyl-tRNA(Asn)/glutamyl-tRNA(Gln) amidotransferase subunit B [Caldicoprobacter guelmensis]|uniref:Asp-tRNA(Asn)/Glu-tRNA(Gln) amidotransferase subunit GatB n=1 Tax=Caldicoprobacter guelmensis TaxID=1170224 RepID=UPI00195C84EA|nr:Asp-tRNA(Asn)/Glu-tRNA(Gln) amidotransferase subunit GatB [Caldicoprobacter guelmensis]MBM7582371.1 aspartyl-tRNA(Asn)/glutamyl-tRNA(Gln) amidotransferase subunit B [Caldicoprobacter guelmensis]
MEYEAVIGLEVHAELSTKSKIFCSCTTEFGGQPNTHCCPVCLGMPGTLPVLNRKAVEYTIKAGLATNCTISYFTKQDRKNYFYPDLPKGYQISQYDLPLCKNGYIEIETENGKKKIRINRIHLEEDAGKLVHSEYGYYSYVDYNRTGVPLIEIVSEPDISSAAEAKAYLEKLKAILQFIGVSDCKMEEGSLRADVNISIRPKGSKELGERTEMKNLNSFRAVYRAIEAEIARQIEVVKSGGTIERETRRWDDARGESYPMRSKEDAQDYRYFPEPDLPPLIIKEELVERLKKELPELPDARKQRYMMEYGLPEYDAGVLTSSKELSDFFEEAAKVSNNIKAISNWVMGDMLRILNERNLEVSQIPFPPAYLAKLVALLDKGVINGPTAKKVFEDMFDSGKDPEVIVKEQGLEVLNDESILLQVVEKVIEENPNSVADYKKGKKKAIGFLVGQAMKATKGKANPQLLNELLIKKLEE